MPVRWHMGDIFDHHVTGTCDAIVAISDSPIQCFFKFVWQWLQTLTDSESAIMIIPRKLATLKGVPLTRTHEWFAVIRHLHIRAALARFFLHCDQNQNKTWRLVTNTNKRTALWLHQVLRFRQKGKFRSVVQVYLTYDQSKIRFLDSSCSGCSPWDNIRVLGFKSLIGCSKPN